MKFCGTCKYFTDKQGPGKVGTCRFTPPNVFWGGDRPISRYPEISPDMRGCGQHEKDKRVISIENSAGYTDEDTRKWSGRGRGGI